MPATRDLAAWLSAAFLALGLAFGGLENRAAAAQPDREPAAAAASSTADEPDPGPFAVKLPNGVTVELVGVSVHQAYKPDPQRKWWKADGSPLDSAPWEFVNARYADSEEYIVREFAVRLLGAGEKAIGTTVDFTEGMMGLAMDRAGYQSTRDPRRPKAVEGVRVLLARIEPARREVTLRYGVAAGGWRTLSWKRGSSSETRVGTRLSPPFEIDGGAAVVAADDQVEKDRRIVAVDRDGTVHEATGQVGGDGQSGDLRMTTARFEGLPPKRIREVRFQVRPYEYAEFHHVSLQPGHRTDASVSAAGAAPSPGCGTSPILKSALGSLLRAYLDARREGSEMPRATAMRKLSERLQPFTRATPEQRKRYERGEFDNEGNAEKTRRAIRELADADAALPRLTRWLIERFKADKLHGAELLVARRLVAHTAEQLNQAEVELPGTRPAAGRDPQPLIVNVTKEGEIFVDGEKLSTAELKQKLAETENPEQVTALIRVDRRTLWRHVVEVFNLLNSAGVRHIGFQPSS